MGDDTRKRASLHKKLQDFLKIVNNHSTSPLTYTPARELMVRVEEIFADYKTVQGRLEATAVDDDAYDVQVAAGAPVEKTFSDVRGQLRTIIEMLSAARTSSTTTTTTATSTSTAATIKLPTIALPEFDGKYSDWMSFKDLFTAAVANNKDLTASQKLQYLKTSLQGEPANLIKYLTTTDANYTEAWTILNTRYSNTREIVQSQINKMLDLRQVRMENARELQVLMDQCAECLHSIKTLGCPTEKWDDMMVVIIGRKLDPATRREWAKKLSGTDLPTLKQLTDFLQTHIRGLNAAGVTSGSATGDRRGEKQLKTHHTATESGQCAVCKGAHHIHECKEFLSGNATERSAMAKKARLCFNCLRSDHMIKSCQSTRKCKKCGARHHTFLHEDRRQLIQQSSQSAKDVTPSVQGHHVAADEGGLLMTAVVYLADRYGRMVACRVFVDSGSEGDFITESCRKRLGIVRLTSHVRISGFGGKDGGTSTGKIQCTLYSRYDNKQLDVELLTTQKVTGQLPKLRRSKSWTHLEGLDLADNEWYEPGEVDILLGVKYFDEIIMLDRRSGPKGSPVAWQTIFGWGVAGRCPTVEDESLRSHHITIEDIGQQVKRFWEVEEPPKRRILTKEEKTCEEHFLQTYKRDMNGRFIVGVPFNEDKLKLLGRSRDIALKRLHQIERRLSRKPEFRAQYAAFMQEYEELGHMSLVPAESRGEEVGRTNYLCHHFVINESSSSTKLRCVFDGSAVTTTGVSLNDVMFVGATLQDDLYDLLLRFRTHAVVLKADIVKMFRQFRLLKKHAEYHRILWRENPEKPVREYRLETVTYGTACAPNLATRCIMQLGKDCRVEYPLASAVLLNDTYIDDVLTGQQTPKDAIDLYHQLTKAVETAGLELRKWSCNDQSVLKQIPDEVKENNQLVFDDNEMIKALGVQWSPSRDIFKFKSFQFADKKQTSKREFLSELASVFDPLGLVSCVTLRSKLLLQEVWKLPVKWDDPVPISIHDRWGEYKRDLAHLDNLEIPRRITVDGACRVELVGFCDSSEVGLGGIVYLRSIFPNGEVQVRFVTSKTRVAPLKQVTLPRLELCAAVLLAELVVHVKESMKLDCEIRLWSDSTIALTWIAAQPRRWKTYVANRVAAIQELTLPSQWSHVAGTENPADLASRGCTVEDLITSKLWWRGPEWLSQPELPLFPTTEVENVDMEERPVIVAAATFEKLDHPTLLHFSSLTRLKRCTAYYIRFLLHRARKAIQTGPLTATEMHAAFLMWIRKVQREHYDKEIKLVQKGQPVGESSSLKSLYPFVDSNGVLRVSGRLQHAEIPDDSKHQIILPRESHLTRLIIAHYHFMSFHGGCQLTWATIRNEFWIVRGKDKVRHFVRSCVRCRRYRARAAEQLMGALPGPRVTPSRPFTHTGVDYAGPFSLKDVVGKVPKVYKAYLCLFVCFATKAVYLEGASSLTTEAFLAAFRRFVSRRGLPSHLYSDCGTNFVGADRELKAFVLGVKLNEAVSREMSERGVTWHFNPPAAPHVGGLWEAAVKSSKHHLRRVMGSGPVTFEQFVTLLSQVECVLNSRPLSALSSEPDDLQPLTPGHFLIGAPLLTAPDADYEDIPRNRLSQFQRIQQQFQTFWNRWSWEYLNTLQQRNKWMWEKENVQVGDLVLLVEESPPATWRMGRIVETHAGKDGKVRVVTVKTATSKMERVVTRLVPLLKTDEQNL